MKIRIEGELPTDLLPSPVTYEVEFVRVEGESNDLTSVYRYVQPKLPSRLERIPQGVRLIGEDFHQLQYTHTTPEGVDVYQYVRSCKGVSDVDHDRFVESVLEKAPEAYDTDDGIESIAVKYVRDLEWVRERAMKVLDEIAKVTDGMHLVLHDFVVQAKQEIARRTRTEL